MMYDDTKQYRPEDICTRVPKPLLLITRNENTMTTYGNLEPRHVTLMVSGVLNITSNISLCCHVHWYLLRQMNTPLRYSINYGTATTLIRKHLCYTPVPLPSVGMKKLAWYPIHCLYGCDLRGRRDFRRTI
jgi:hypothetical protein